MVSFDTVREQLLYEVHDPAAYLNPDVTADFTSVRLDDLGGDRVRVHGIEGTPAPVTYKGLVCTAAGYSGEARLGYPWPDAEAKARAAARFMVARAEQLGIEVLEWHEEYFGLDAFGGPTVPVDQLYEGDAEPSEVMVRVVWRCERKADAARLAPRDGSAGSGWPADGVAVRSGPRHRTDPADVARGDRGGPWAGRSGRPRLGRDGLSQLRRLAVGQVPGMGV